MSSINWEETLAFCVDQLIHDGDVYMVEAMICVKNKNVDM